MKKLKMFSFLFIFAIIGAVFTGCGSDDDDDKDDDATSTTGLVGHWVYDDDEMIEFEFFSDGTCSYEEYYDKEEEYGEGTYIVKGNKLTVRLTFGDETERWKYTIKSLTSKKRLVLEDEDGDTYSFTYYKR